MNFIITALILTSSENARHIQIFKWEPDHLLVPFRPRWPYGFNPLWRQNSTSSQRPASCRDNACVINLFILKRGTRKKTKDQSRDFCLRIS